MAKIPSVYLGSSGLKVSVLALGTMTFGNWGKASQCADEATAFAILDAYAAAGGNFIDTADIYAGGESEITVGKWLALRKSERHKFVLASKARFSSDPGAGPNDVGLSRHHLLRSVNSSLERLGVEYIDLFQCHAWDSGTPLEETLRTLDDLVKAGKIHYVGKHPCIHPHIHPDAPLRVPALTAGWSNVTGWQLQKIVCESRRLGLSPCVSLQAQYSLLCRQTGAVSRGCRLCVHRGESIDAPSPLPSLPRALGCRVRAN
jgi:aryl-alcohol dehydrogenase-like predicted oxidoreductase